MTAFLAFTITGIVYGCIYAVTATGVVVTYTTTGIFNLAHGAIGMLAAYTYWQLWQGWHWPQWLAVLTVLLVLAPLFGVVFERVLMRPLYGASVDLIVVVTLGSLLLFVGLALIFWNQNAVRYLPPFFSGKTARLGILDVSYHKILVFGLAIIVAVILKLLFSRTRVGIAMRAVVDNPDLAAMAGARPTRIQQLSWMLGASLAALAGILLAPLTSLNALLLTLLVINGYAAAMIGRLRNLPLTVAGGLLVGLLDSYLVGYGSAFWKDVELILPMIVLFIVLVILPQDRLRTGTITGKAMPRAASFRQSVLWAGILIVAAVVISGHLSPSNVQTGSKALAYAFILLSLVLLTGYGGLVSLCQFTFVGLGAYAMGHFGHHGSLVGVLVAGGLAAAVGALVALPTLRLRGLYLALATLAFAQAMDNLFFVNKKVLGAGGSLDVDRIRIPGIPTQTDRAFFLLITCAFAVAAVGVLSVRRHAFGRRLAALNDSPAACATLGLNINWTKLVVFSASAGLAGLGGAMLGGVTEIVSNNNFILFNSLILLLLVRIGGVNTISGAFLGALLFAAFPVLAKYIPHLPNQLVLTGLGAIALGRDPDGFGGRIARAGERLREKWHAGRTSDPVPVPEHSAEEGELVHA